jgi:hypothetical protein
LHRKGRFHQRLQKSKENFLWWLEHAPIYDSGDYRDTVFVGGVGRSGTTWLAETINHDGAFRIIFEPFRTKKNPLLSGWHQVQYLRETDRCPDRLDAVLRILSGQIKSRSMNSHNFKKFATKRLIKEVRANLLFKWLKVNFPEIRLIFLIRHPCAVAYSMMQTAQQYGFEWQNSLEVYLRQPDLMTDYLEPFRSKLEEAKELFEILIYVWCIENYVPLKALEQDQAHVLFYEDLCISPEPTLRKLMGYLNMAFNTRILQAVHKPSALARSHSAILNDHNLTLQWMQNLNDSQQEKAQTILSVFGLHKLYATNGMPAMNGQQVLSLMKTS